jgi:hypothetical protein
MRSALAARLFEFHFFAQMHVRTYIICILKLKYRPTRVRVCVLTIITRVCTMHYNNE